MSAIRSGASRASLPAVTHADDIDAACPGYRQHDSPQGSVLVAAADQSAVVVDIPKSIEEAQVLLGRPLPGTRLLSSQPQQAPWTLPEPKATKADTRSHATVIAELMTIETCLAALENVRKCHGGDSWCLPRVNPFEVSEIPLSQDNTLPPGKRKAEVTTNLTSHEPKVFVPEQSHYIAGNIQETRDKFVSKTSSIIFDLVVLDPPWPSRSARRKKSGNGYATVGNMTEACDLLGSIPIPSRLSPGGLIAVWITNKPAVYDALVQPGGIFTQWGVELVGEWIWLKITATGEPIFDIHSEWRKPWERLLLARPKSNGDTKAASLLKSQTKGTIPTKVVIAVPDLHSRKPNLRGLLQEFLPRDYLGLEVFARNLTAGWWAWGNEPLLFQTSEQWLDCNEKSKYREDELRTKTSVTLGKS